LTGQRYIGDDLPILKSDAKIVYMRLESTVSMQDVYSASDLVVARAGASTVAEVSTIGIASVLVPWSGAAENHQTANASWLGDLGGAQVIDEKSVTNDQLADQVIALIDDRAKLQSLASAARSAGQQHRETTLAKLILNVAGQKERQLIDLRKPTRIHVVGVGGPGMSAIATVLAEMGHQVSGSDIRRSDVITRLEALGIKVNIGHDPEVVFGCDFVTGSPAIAESNIEYQRARESDIRVLSRAETLASICKCATSIGVAGTHGKTTTSSMLTTILLSANKNPSYLIGGDVIALNRGASWSNSELFVVEADESDGTHSQLPLAATIVTNIDIDHLDHFKTQSAIERSFFDRDESDKWSRVVAVFQPNRFNRMSMISHLYGDSFVAADLIVITDIYSSGTEPIAGVTGQLVVDAILESQPQSHVIYQPSRENLVEFLADEIKDGDLCISMGCGDISSLPNEVIARRRGKSN